MRLDSGKNIVREILHGCTHRFISHFDNFLGVSIDESVGRASDSL